MSGKNNQPLAKLLVEAGFTAIGHAQFFEAEKLFRAASEIAEVIEPIYLGLSLTYIAQGAHAKAIYILREGALKEDPHNPLFKAYLACVLKFSNFSNESIKLAEEVLKNKENRDAIAIAKAVLDEVRRENP